MHNLDKPELKQSECFLQAVLEGFVDGILVLTEQQTVIYANATARSLCNQLAIAQTESLPTDIQRLCDALMESRDIYGDCPLTLETEITTRQSTFRLRAQWLHLDSSDRPCILLKLQDQNQSIQSLAISEAQTWNLTPRESEVWLLRRAGFTRKAIAAELYIALDTVKKHLKNIQAKRQGVLDEQKWQMTQAS